MSLCRLIASTSLATVYTLDVFRRIAYGDIISCNYLFIDGADAPSFQKMTVRIDVSKPPSPPHPTANYPPLFHI